MLLTKSSSETICSLIHLSLPTIGIIRSLQLFLVDGAQADSMTPVA